MNFHYLFQNYIEDKNVFHKLIIVKQIRKYKYILELYRKTIDQIPNIDTLKIGCFLYMKNNKYCIYDSKNYIIKEFNEPAEFLVENNYHRDIGNALKELFCKKY